MFPQCWRFQFCLVRKYAGHMFYQVILPGRACCTDSQGSLPGWCWISLIRGSGLPEAVCSVSILFSKTFHTPFWCERKKTTPQSPVLEMSEVVIDKSADSSGACLLQFSPSRCGGTLKCAMFTFPQGESVAFAPTPSSWRKGKFVPFCGGWSPTRRTFNLSNGHIVCLPKEVGGCVPVPCMDPTWTMVSWPSLRPWMMVPQA